MVNIGIIGTGVGVRTHFKTFQKLKNAHVIAISGSTKQRAKQVAQEYGISKYCEDYKELINIEELDLVCITSPNIYHYEQARYCIEKGKNMLLEKPVGMNIEETTKLVQMSKGSNKINIVNHQLRYNPYLQKVRELISQDKLGRLYYINIHQQSNGFSNLNMPWTWSLEENQGGGVRLAMGVHLIDLLRFWTNKKVLSVKGNMDSVIPERIHEDGKSKEVTTCSFFSSNLNLEDNLTVNISATCASCRKKRFWIFCIWRKR